jgi:hypothetical protein
MKVNRNVLLWICAGLGVFIILYSLFRHFTGFSLGEKYEKWLMDGVMFAALAIFMYNRKLTQDERKAKAAAEQEKLKAEQIEEVPEEEKDIPHWERNGTSDAEE